jgi:hypothetical protein
MLVSLEEAAEFRSSLIIVECAPVSHSISTEFISLIPRPEIGIDPLDTHLSLHERQRLVCYGCGNDDRVRLAPIFERFHILLEQLPCLFRCKLWLRKRRCIVFEYVLEVRVMSPQMTMTLHYKLLHSRELFGGYVVVVPGCVASRPSSLHPFHQVLNRQHYQHRQHYQYRQHYQVQGSEDSSTYSAKSKCIFEVKSRAARILLVRSIGSNQ